MNKKNIISFVVLITAVMLTRCNLPKGSEVKETKSTIKTHTDTTSIIREDLSFTVNSESFTMKYVEGGTFMMGVQDEDPNRENYMENLMVFSHWGPVHEVTVNSFYIGETEVTQALWQAVMGNTVRQQRDETNASYYMRGEGDNYPMYYVSWEDCQEFISKLSNLTGKDFRLPTEAEWEYAARGGRKSHGYPFAGNSEIDSVVAYYTETYEFLYYDNEEEVQMDESERPGTNVVKTLMPNELGLYNMSGNVSEWCSDWYDEDYYANSPSNNPQGPDVGEFRVVRGGGWFDLEGGCCVFSRGMQESSKRNSNTGLRLVISID